MDLCNISFCSNIPQIDGNNSYNSSTNSLDVSITESISSISSSISEKSSVSVTRSLENSWFSQYSESESSSPAYIPVMIGHRPWKIICDDRQSVRPVIRRENKCVQALGLPHTLVFNMRSIWTKLNN